MDPWLKTPAIWRDVHHRIITALAEELAPLLRPRYFIAIETHTYIALAPDLPISSAYPDVMVINQGGAPVAAGAAANSAPYVTIELPIPEPVEEGYLEVRLVPTGEVVTVIELLSHSNKQPGRDRETYVEKRDTLLDSRVNFAVDLGELIKRTYDRAGYDLVLKYDQPPAPALTAEDSAWAASLLETAP